MIKRVLCNLLGSIAATALIYVIFHQAYCGAHVENRLFCSEIIKLETFYADNIRGHLFTGFLALSGFLLSLKTFIVVNMKENVYDNDEYQVNIIKQKKLDDSITLYGPLKELSDLLYYAILAGIISAGLQMTLGLYPHWIASLICLWSALLALLLLIDCLRLIKSNLDSWFKLID